MSIQILEAISRCGTITQKIGVKNISDFLEEIQSLELKELVKKTKDKPYYYLTPKGKRFVFRTMSHIVGDIYVSTSPAHDEKLCEFYFGLTEEERKTWKTRSELQRKYGLQSVFDSLYTNEEGLLIGVVVLDETAKIDKIMKFEELLKTIKVNNIFYVIYKKGE